MQRCRSVWLGVDAGAHTFAAASVPFARTSHLTLFSTSESAQQPSSSSPRWAEIGVVK